MFFSFSLLLISSSVIYFRYLFLFKNFDVISLLRTTSFRGASAIPIYFREWTANLHLYLHLRELSKRSFESSLRFARSARRSSAFGMVRGPERRDVSSLNALTIALQNLDGAFSNRVEADGKLTRDDIACN